MDNLKLKPIPTKDLIKITRAEELILNNHFSNAIHSKDFDQRNFSFTRNCIFLIEKDESNEALLLLENMEELTKRIKEYPKRSYYQILLLFSFEVLNYKIQPPSIFFSAREYIYVYYEGGELHKSENFYTYNKYNDFAMNDFSICIHEQMLSMLYHHRRKQLDREFPQLIIKSACLELYQLTKVLNRGEIFVLSTNGKDNLSTLFFVDKFNEILPLYVGDRDTVDISEILNEAFRFEVSTAEFSLKNSNIITLNSGIHNNSPIFSELKYFLEIITLTNKQLVI